MSEQRRLNVTIEKKIEILQMLEKGESVSLIAAKYDIELMSVYTIYIEKENIKAYMKKNAAIAVQRTQRSFFKRIVSLERVLYHWCMRCWQKRIEFTGSDIRRKARELNEKLYGDPNFIASAGWLIKFRERYGFTLEDIRQYLPLPSKIAADNFKFRFNKFLQINEITLENVYNVCYTAMMWKSVPEVTSIFCHAKWTGNQQICEDHVTALLCANATGCHKLPVLIIGNVAEPRSSSILNIGTTSTIYKVNTNAWMDSTIFKQWFEDHFLKSVEERQKMKGRRERTLLLLDNTTLLHNLNELNEKDKFVSVISFPSDVSPTIQPMNNEIIDCFKRLYRRELVITLMLLPVWNIEEEVIQVHKKLTLWDSCYMVHDAWSYVDNAILKCGWDILLGIQTIRHDDLMQILSDNIDETTAYLQTIPGCQQCDPNFVLQWFKMDSMHDIAMKISTDETLRDLKNGVLDD